VTALYRPPRKEVLSNFVYQGRRKTGADLAPANVQGVKKLITDLRKGKMLFILTDQLPKAAGKQGSVFAPFFGQPASTMVLVNSLARRTGAPVFFFIPRGIRMRVAMVCTVCQLRWVLILRWWRRLPPPLTWVWRRVSASFLSSISGAIRDLRIAPMGIVPPIPPENSPAPAWSQV